MRSIFLISGKPTIAGNRTASLPVTERRAAPYGLTQFGWTSVLRIRRWKCACPNPASVRGSAPEHDLRRCASRRGAIDRHALAAVGDKLGRDELEPAVAHRLQRWSAEGVGEGDLVIGQSEVRRTIGGGLHSFRWLDRFLDGSLGGDGAVMLGVEDLPNFSLKC